VSLSGASGKSAPRLGLAFAAVGVTLLLAVAALVHSAVQRLERQRDLRHRMVAERIFDEVERELSSLLQHESERPSGAYDAASTQVGTWSEFIVGYYRREPALVVLAEAQLPAERVARVAAAVARVDLRGPADAPPEQALAPAPKLAAEPLAGSGHASSPEVLQKLNRGARVRARQQRRLDSSFEVHVVDASTLLFERAGSEPERREGFVVDVPRLVGVLQRWLLDSQGLGQLATLARAEAAQREPGAGHRFDHRLATPFDSQALVLRLSELDDADESRALFGLSALLVTAVLFGLFALYRMVTVRLGFAERRDNFVSAVSHELKTPLTAIRMYAEMLREGMVADEATRQDYYTIMTAEAERLTRLINNVLEHARLRKGQRPVQLLRGDAAGVVREVLEVLRPHLESEGFSVDLQVEPGLPAVRFDADALKQVLFNVADNALKYGRGVGEARLEIRCVTEAGQVVIGVRDFGPGLEPARLGQVFEPFFRGESELTRRRTGTGLGLALVRDLVRAMHGTVSCHNREPGLEVRVALPAG
jgi:signal transduction histidine kinase